MNANPEACLDFPHTILTTFLEISPGRDYSTAEKLWRYGGESNPTLQQFCRLRHVHSVTVPISLFLERVSRFGLNTRKLSQPQRLGVALSLINSRDPTNQLPGNYFLFIDRLANLERIEIIEIYSLRLGRPRTAPAAYPQFLIFLYHILFMLKGQQLNQLYL